MGLNIYDLVLELLKKGIKEIYIFIGIILIGFVVSKIISFFIVRFLMKIELDKFLEKYKFREAVFNINLIELVRIFTFWYIFLMFVTYDFKLVELNDFYKFFYNLISYYFPNFFYGVILIIIGFWIAYLVKKRIEEEGFLFSSLISKVVYYITLYLIIVNSLPNFGIDNSIFLDIFRYLVIGISFGIGLAIGIGFGLLLKNYLEKELNKL